jgi:hypothetical protein
MLIFWRIRYFDRTEKTFKDRDLCLDTATLPPAKGAAVELLAEAKGNRSEREFLKFKSLFREESLADCGEARLNADHASRNGADPDRKPNSRPCSQRSEAT